jgi:hypothetical protein
MDYLLIVMALIAAASIIVAFLSVRKVGSLNDKVNSLSVKNGELAGVLKAKEDYDLLRINMRSLWNK